MPQPFPNAQRRPAPSRSSKARLRRVPFPVLPDDSPVKAQLERIVGSRTFSGAHRSQLFLRYILHHTVAHPDKQPKEYSIAVDVFDRDASYDPAVNNTVRVEAGRLRSRLLEYYAREGRTDPLLLEVPKGSYRVIIHARQPVPAPAAAPVLLPLQTPDAPHPLAPGRLSHLWAVPLAFLIGAFLGYRASH